MKLRTTVTQRLSRRAALVAGACAGSGLLASQSSQKPTAFALCGDRYHNIDYIRVALGKTLVKDLGIGIDFSDELTLLNRDHLRNYRVLILFRDGMVWPSGYLARGSPPIVSDPPLPKIEAEPVYWITADQGRAVKDFVQSGGGVLFYHNVTYISPHNDNFRDVLGAVTEGHPPMRKFKVRIINKEHPITRGVNDFIVTDEQHFMTYQKDRRYLLMESVNEDGLTWKNLGTTSPAGWAYDYGKGRVCYLAPGHMITALWNHEYEKIQKNAVRWLLKSI